MTSKDFTLTDLIVLWVLDPRYRYMARNRSGLISVFESKPFKGERQWEVDYSAVERGKMGYAIMEALDDDRLSAISWDDDEPFVIPSREVIANVISNIMYGKLLTGEFNTSKGWFL